MKMRQFQIENFRSMKPPTWNPPYGQQLIVLMDPGNSGKSPITTCLEIDGVFGFTIQISMTSIYRHHFASRRLADIPSALLTKRAFGHISLSEGCRTSPV